MDYFIYFFLVFLLSDIVSWLIVFAIDLMRKNYERRKDNE